MQFFSIVPLGPRLLKYTQMKVLRTYFHLTQSSFEKTKEVLELISLFILVTHVTFYQLTRVNDLIVFTSLDIG